MKLPHSDKAEISAAKLRLYLLSREHPIGRFKAAFFERLGFHPDNWREMEAALLEAARTGRAESLGSSPYGEKYLIRCTLKGPQGAAQVDTIWMISTGSDRPQLVTVYPTE